ncbi:S1 RNA-binding domain-containing protein, partial [Oscillatoriales cyanobacterium LEGE 11467]
IKPYGAFVDVGGVTGLLHIRQISQNRIDSLSDVLSEGQNIKVLVAEVDEWKGRISLATKVFENYAGELLENFDEVMANAETRWDEKQSGESESTPKPKPEVKSKPEVKAKTEEEEK